MPRQSESVALDVVFTEDVRISVSVITASAAAAADADANYAVHLTGNVNDETFEFGDGDEEDDESSLSVPTHRALSRQEISILETPGLCVVHARPGDVVAFSSAATHFAVNGNAKPCAACFHGVLTPGT